jgi:hypothetical protein
MTTLPIYAVNGGLDFKFDAEEMPSILHGIMSEADYMEFIGSLNRKLEKHRHKKKDMACLATGVVLLPLVPFLYRHAKHKKRARLQMQEACRFWNAKYPDSGLKWTVDRTEGSIYFQSFMANNNLPPF